MAGGRDTLRIVDWPKTTLLHGWHEGQRPIVVFDLNDGDGFIRDRAAGFTFNPATATQQVSRRTQRYGGGRIVGETHDNGSISWVAYVRGSTPFECAQRVESMLQTILSTARDKYVEWAPDSLPSSYLEIAGPGSWAPTYDPLMLAQSTAMRVQITFPVFPLVRWSQMTIYDDFGYDSSADYVATGQPINEWLWAISGPGNGILDPVGNTAAEHRLTHTARGYKTLEGQATTSLHMGGTFVGAKTGVLLRVSSAATTTYVETYVDDNGTNTRLRIDVVIAGVRTNRASVNITRWIGNDVVKIRGRIENQTVFAEYWDGTLDPTPLGTPISSTSYTLSAPEQVSLVAGYSGISVNSNGPGCFYESFTFQPYAYRNATLPNVFDSLDAIPGTAPALATVKVSPSGGSATPIWGLVAWDKWISTVHFDPVFEVVEDTYFIHTTWGTSAQAGARGGIDTRATASGSAQTFLSKNQFFADTQETDEFSDSQWDVEVWARVITSSGLVNPRISAFTGGFTTTYTVEWGPVGKLIPKPSAGTVYRFTRLGTLSFNTQGNTVPYFGLAGSLDAGSSGVFGFDYIIMVPVRRRAVMVTGVPSANVPAFVPSTAAWTKMINSDLASLIKDETYGLAFSGKLERSAGMGGSLIQPNPGITRWLVKLSSLVADDPTSNTSTEQLAHSASVYIDVIPRSFMLRNAQ